MYQPRYSDVRMIEQQGGIRAGRGAVEARAERMSNPMRGVLFGAALAVPAWGMVAVTLHALWGLVR